jgi:murein DD-endopeptidase MepM/ murein hydrolase activator NlpD
MRRAWPLGLALALLAGCADAPTIPQVHPLPEGRLSSDYGLRTVDPVSGEAKPSGHHDGYDLAAALGTPIRASKAGKVSFAGRKGGYGNAVILSHPGGWSTLYGHASRLAVAVGQEVEAGAIVAYVGSTGHSTGPHLHYELRLNGKPVNPGLFSTAAKPPAASPPAAGPSRKVRALRSAPTPPPVEAAVQGVSESSAPPEGVAALPELPPEAPPLRYPSDPGVQSAMRALDGAPMTPELLAAAEPPPLWLRLKNWLSAFVHQVATLFTARRAT